MKKFILLAAAALAIGVALCAIAWFAAPVAAGAAMLFGGLNLLSKPLGIPPIVTGLVFLALLPSAVIWLLRVFSAKVRKWIAIALIALAVIYALVSVALTNQHLVAAAQSAAASIHKLWDPITVADPASAWFNPDGSPRLFVHPTTNVWRFYKGAYLAGAHDPATGAKLQPVTPELRIEWQAEQTHERDVEAAKEEKAERLVLEVHRQQLESVQDSLQKEKAALMLERRAVLNRLLQQLEAKQNELTAKAARLPEPIQLVNCAGQKLTDTKAALACSMTNGVPLDMAAVQDEVAASMSNADLAEAKIQAAGDAQEKAKAAALATAEKMADLEAKEKQQEEEQRKIDEASRGLASEKTALENMKEQVADGQKEIEAERQKLEIEAAAKQASSSQVEQARNDQSVASEDNQDARNQEVVVAAPTRYWIIDGRGQEFGPVNLAQLQLWISQGRANSSTPIFADGWRAWQPLGSILPCPAPVIYYRYYRQPTYYVRIWR